MAAKTQTQYVALVGLNYPTTTGEVRVEAGEKCVDLPTKSVTWLRDQGLIVDKKAESAIVEDAPTDDVDVVEEGDD